MSFNGADGSNNSNLDPSRTLGGNPSPYPLTAIEAVTISCAVVALMVVVCLVFYCRQLNVRRNLDMALAARRSGVGSSSAGRSIELEENKADEGETGAQGEQAGVGGGEGVRKPPLWRYVGFKGGRSLARRSGGSATASSSDLRLTNEQSVV